MHAQQHGPLVTDAGIEFRVWAPEHPSVELVLYDDEQRERARMPMAKDDTTGFHRVSMREARPGDLYAYAIGSGKPMPDPASRAQPFGVHGPSRVVDPRALHRSAPPFAGRKLAELVIYEAHVGTITPEGTFRALVDRLDSIADLGVTAIELMPIADFAGNRNWGYDGVALFAPARCYGSPEDLAHLVDEAHRRGLSMILDVVYNHLGPDGAYHRAFSEHYFDDRHQTPWGQGWNYDGASRDAVRSFVLENVDQWIRDYRFDGLRLDATHAILDDSEEHLLSSIVDRARTAGEGRPIHVIAEDERNEARLLRARPQGLGLDAVWADDFHHEVRRIIAGDDEGYFADYRGDVEELATILRRGWLYQGQPAVSHDGRPRGTSAEGLAPWQFVHCIQNHDQVGNRAMGDRLQGDPARIKAAVTLLLMSPYTPMLFMGQEFSASSPFAYFTDHAPELGALVTEGRRQEFQKFRAFADPVSRAKIPDPQSRDTFAASKLDWREADRSPGLEMRTLHRSLLSLRRGCLADRSASPAPFEVRTANGLLAISRPNRTIDREGSLHAVIGLSTGGAVDLRSLLGPSWESAEIVLDTESAEYGGSAPACLEGPMLTLSGPGAVVLST